MRNKIILDTGKDIANFLTIANSLTGKIYVTNSEREFVIDAKSYLGLAAAKEFDELWIESEHDYYRQFESFIID